jgi:Membrane-associated phospholipid phosphatase
MNKATNLHCKPEYPSFLHYPVSKAAALTVFLALSLFCYLAFLVQTGNIPEWDKRLLLAFRSFPDGSRFIRPEMFEQAMKDFTALGGTAVQNLIGFIVILYLSLVRRFRLALVLSGILIGGLLVSSSLKYVFNRPRPDIVSHLSYIFTQSFPSGHSMMSAITFLTCAILFSRSQPQPVRIFMISCAVLLTFLVGSSRVYLGVHWPSDVLAGWSLGLAWIVFWLGIVFRENRKFR